MVLLSSTNMATSVAEELPSVGMAYSGTADTQGIRLQSRHLQIQQQRFYFDVCENDRGLFLKVTEVAKTRKRWNIIVPEAVADWFLDMLDACLRETAEGRQLPSKELRVENKVYYFVAQMAMGKPCTLRISEHGGPKGKSSIMVPAVDAELHGWADFIAMVGDAIATLKRHQAGGLVRQLPQDHQVMSLQRAMLEQGLLDAASNLLARFDISSKPMASELLSPEVTSSNPSLRLDSATQEDASDGSGRLSGSLQPKSWPVSSSSPLLAPTLPQNGTHQLLCGSTPVSAAADAAATPPPGSAAACMPMASAALDTAGGFEDQQSRLERQAAEPPLQLELGGKSFLFRLGRDRHGWGLHISETHQPQGSGSSHDMWTSLMIPLEGLEQLRDALSHFCLLSKLPDGLLTTS